MFPFSGNPSTEYISETNKVSSSMIASENVTIHEGDLIINGTQTYVIENCTYIQRGNIRVSDSARVKVRNAILRIDPQDYWFQFEFSVDSQATLEVFNSTVNVPEGAWLSCAGNSNVNIVQSSLEGIPVGAADRSNVVIDSARARQGSARLFPSAYMLAIVLGTISKIIYRATSYL
jgi:hypothetical protein